MTMGWDWTGQAHSDAARREIEDGTARQDEQPLWERRQPRERPLWQSRRRPAAGPSWGTPGMSGRRFRMWLLVIFLAGIALVALFNL